MHANHRTLQTFYEAFARLDADTMTACYAPDAVFDDEAFALKGRREVAGMWQMLCSGARARGLDRWRLEFRDLQADATRGSAHWEAHYEFGPKGRPVHNRIDAHFTFNADGLIATHRDRFDFAVWARQALGPVGWMLGWSPWLRAKVRAQARRTLDNYLAAQPKEPNE